VLERFKSLFGRGAAQATRGGGDPFAEGERLLAAGDREAAVDKLREAAAAAPTDPRPLLPLAVALREQGATDEARQVLERLVRIEPASVDASFLLGLLHEGRGALAEAAACFRRVIELAPALPDGYVQLCQVEVVAGRFDAAREAVAKGLRVLADHAALHFLLANLHLQAGSFEAAEAAYRRALDLQPDWPEAHYHRALAAQGAGHLDDASRHLTEALRLRPDYRAARLASARLHRTGGRYPQALSDFEHVLATEPGDAEALFGRAAERLRAGQAAEALDDFERLLAVDPARSEAWLNRGSALLELGRPAQALESIDRALAAGPASGGALLARARALRSLERAKEALEAARQAVRSADAEAPLLNDLGLLLRDLGDRPAALEAFERALSLRPAFAAALANRGLILQESRRPEDALRDLDAALVLDAGLADAHASRGNVLQELDRHEEALQSYARAFALRPDLEDAYLNEGLARLVTGDLAGGWPRYEWRWRSSGAPHPATRFAQPMWDGRQSLEGKTVFLYAEQGLGDTIQFCRYAERVKALGATVVLGVQAALSSLLQGLAGVDRLLVLGDTLPAFDYHAPLLSLPGLFATTLESIPAKAAYLPANAAALAEPRAVWRAQLAAARHPRIGVVWSGNPDHRNDANRSIPLETFRRIFAAPAAFFCLQNELRAGDAAALADTPQVAYVGPQLVDFAATAALVAELDLVISVDTSVAHLAAAMGRPVWLLLPTNPDWRWLLDRKDSPWYPTMRLFRQERRGDWNGVMEQVAQEIARLR